jgi:hypothetical protein
MILHTEYHRLAAKPTPDRFSRHYADTAALAKRPAASRAIGQHDLRNRVVEWQSLRSLHRRRHDFDYNEGKQRRLDEVRSW